MDALSDLLRVVGLTGGIFLEARFTAPWCMLGKVGPEQCAPFMTTPSFVIGFHYLVEGSCSIGVDGEEPCFVEAGEVVLLPHNALHRFGSDLGRPAIPVSQVLQAPDPGRLPRIEHGGGGQPCAMVCGFLGGDAQLSLLIKTLPSLLKLKVRDTQGGEWIEQSFRYAAAGLAGGDPGAATIMSKMCELLFVDAVRRYLTTMPEEKTGFLAGLRDPAVGKALALLHSHVARAWTAEDLASAVNLSRSAFADRFTSLIGQPPMTYLTQWRMQVAAQKLREGRQSIGQIAFDIGYESEAAFTRAFKRELGVPPATWRKRLGNGPAAGPLGP